MIFLKRSSVIGKHDKSVSNIAKRQHVVPTSTKYPKMSEKLHNYMHEMQNTSVILQSDASRNLCTSLFPGLN